MNKKTLRIAGWALGLSMAVAGIGAAVGVSNNSVQVNAAEAKSQTIGFESAEGFTTGTDYQSTQTYSLSNPTWSVFYGTVSTSSKITGSNSLAMRCYNGNNNLGYARTTSGISYLTKLVFNAKAQESNSAKLKLTIKYSNDGGANWSSMLQTSDTGAAWSGVSLTSSAASYTAYMPSAAKGTSASTLFEFSIDSSSTKPTKSNVQMTIDDIDIYRDVQTSVEFSNPTTSVLIGGTVTNVASGNNLGGAAISYSSATPSVATVNASTGEVTGVSVGSSVITASATVDDIVYSANYTITVAAPTVSFATPTTSVFVGGTVTNAATNNAGAAITYSSATPSVATVNASTGEVTGVSAGESIITASFTYAAKSYSSNYTMNVRAPYSVSEAIAAIDAGTGTSNVSVTGIVSEIVTSSLPGWITYNISSDGSTSGNQFQVYRGLSYDSEDFTSIDEIKVGDTIVGFGNIKKYSSTYEFEAESRLVSLSRPTYTISFNANGGTGDMDAIPDLERGDYDLPACDFTAPDGYIFAGWKVGNAGDVLAAGTSYAIAGDITLYAQWGALRSLSVTSINGTYSGDTQIAENGAATVTLVPNSHYKLPDSITVTNATYTYNSSTGVVSLSNPTGNVTVSATMVALANYSISVNALNCTYVGASSIEENGEATITFATEGMYGLPSSVTVTGATIESWNKSTGVLVIQNPTANVSITISASIVYPNNAGEYHVATEADIKVGAHLIIAAGEAGTVMGAQSGNNCPEASGAKYTENGNKLVTKTNAQDIELVAGASAGTFGMKVADDTYLYAASSSSNYLKTKSTVDGNASFSFTRVNDTDWTIVANGDSARKYVRYNSASSLFSCYEEGKQGAVTVYAYKSFQEEATTYATNFIKGSENANTCAATISAWSTLGTSYGNLTNGAKNLLKNEAHHEPDGYEPTEYSIAHAIARYDLVLKAYGTSTYTDFMGRVDAGKLSLSNNIYFGMDSIGDNNIPLIITVAASVGLLTTGGIFLISRKRREE